MADVGKLLELSKETAGLMKKGKGLVTEEFLQDFADQYDNLKDKAEDVMNPDRDLHVGIVGQVKAGKSSFLNAILFDGKDILPKAATPMTAGLTRIVYAEQEYAKVCYYDEADWKGIERGSKYFDEEFERGCDQKKEEKRAREERRAKMQQGSGMHQAWNHAKDKMYGIADHVADSFQHVRKQIALTKSEEDEVIAHIPDKLRACKQLTELVAKAGGDLLSRLGTEEEIPFERLAEYIGARGAYAPIVKSIEVGVNMPDVKGLEIIDTPGLGDPIVSRSERTRQFLMKCDLVILLSISSQFMKEEDLNLVGKTLPENSIQQVCFVASQFDAALLEDSERGRADLVRVIRRTQGKLDKTLRKQLEDYGKRVPNPLFRNILQQIQREDEAAGGQKAGSQHLNCVASLLYGAGRKKEQGMPWTEEEEHIIHQLERRFSGMDEEAETLKDLSGIERFKQREFLPLRDKKEQVIRERQAEFVDDQWRAFLEKVEAIRYEAEGSLRQLNEGDIASVTAKIHQAENAAFKMRRKLKEQFEESGLEASRRLREISNDIRDCAEKFTDLEVREEIKKTQHVETHWFKKDEHWEETERYYVAPVQTVIHNINRYVDAANRLIEENMSHALDIDEMKRKVREIVVDGFLQGEADFEPEDITGPLGLLLGRMILPPFQTVDKEKYRNLILQRFSDGTVRDEEIHSLMTANEQVLDMIKEDIVGKLQGFDQAVQKFVSEQSVTFADDVEKQIVGKMNLLKENLENKQENVKRFESFIRDLAACKDAYRKLA